MSIVTQQLVSLCNVHLPDVIKVVTRRGVRSVESVACMGTVLNAYRIAAGTSEVIRARRWWCLILNGYQRTACGIEGRGLGSCGSGCGPVASCCEHGNEAVFHTWHGIA